MALSLPLREHVDRLLADEYGTIYKQAPTLFTMLYPSPYRAGMSSLGYQMLYREINNRPDTVAERAFHPDEPELYRKSRTPVFTFESKRPIGDSDIIGISLAYKATRSVELAQVPRDAARMSLHIIGAIVAGAVFLYLLVIVLLPMLPVG